MSFAAFEVPSLVHLCCAAMAGDLSLIAGQLLPARLVQTIVTMLHERRCLTDEALLLLPETAALDTLDLSQSTVSASFLAQLHPNTLTSLSLAGCATVDDAALVAIARVSGSSLVHLDLRDCENIPPAGFLRLSALSVLESLNLSGTGNVHEEILSILPSSLRCLNMSHHPELSFEAFLTVASHNAGIRMLQWAGNPIGFPTGVALAHFLPNLTTLDLSFCSSATDEWPGDLIAACHALPHLAWLDLSGTIVSRAALQELCGKQGLAFLGACSIPELVDIDSALTPPATLTVAANHYRPHILAAVVEFCTSKNASLVQELQRELFQIAKLNFDDDLGAQRTALTQAVARAMRTHPDNRPLQLVCSGVMFYLTLLRNPGVQDVPTRRAVVPLLLAALENHMSCVEVVRNCALTFNNFRGETELAVESHRITGLLFEGALQYNEFGLQHAVLGICSHTLASLHPCHKARIGTASISKVMELIHQKATEGPPEPAQNVPAGLDQFILEQLWAFLWNVTDESAVNSSLFVNTHDGLHELFFNLDSFPGNFNIRRNTMGLLTNLAEVPALRPQLMTPRLIDHLQACLEIEPVTDLRVTYNAAGTLSHFIAEGHALWLQCGHTLERREAVLNILFSVVNQWDYAAEKYINYRSLRPVYLLLRPHVEWQVQNWAAWALASLCTSDPNKYCELICAEGGEAPIKAMGMRSVHGSITKSLEIIDTAMAVWKARGENVPS